MKVQREVGTLQKDSINPHFKNKYIGLDTLIEKVLPLLNDNGILLLQPVTIADGSPALTTMLVHTETGETLQHTMFLVLDKDSPQGQGSAITYARRYSLMSYLGLVADVDDDGEATKPRKTLRKTVENKQGSGLNF